MNNNHTNELIDESELRAALQPLRPNPDSFVAGIRQRLDEAEIRLRDGESGEEFGDARLDDSDWLQAAAAVIPLPLLGKSGGAGLVKLGQLSLGKKMVAVAALPAIGLLLMVTATIWAIVRIRRAQREQLVGDFDAQKVGEVTAGWWRQFGILVIGMSAASLLLMFAGHTIPVFIVFLISGITMVSLITRLGKERLVNRSAIVGTLLPGLMILVQVTQSITILSPGKPFLDQMLIPTVLLLGVFAMSFMSASPREHISRTTGLVAKLLLGIMVLLMAGWFGSSLWNPVTTQDLKAIGGRTETQS